MPSTVLRVAVCALVLLAGCGAIGSSTPGTTQSTTTTPADACPPVADYERQALPERPETWDDESVAQFTEEYETAYVWNRLLDRAETDLSVDKRARVVDRTTDGFVVHVEGSATYSTCSNGQRAVADSFVDVNYFVNRTLVVRIENPENLTTNPRTDDGTVVETRGC